MSTVYVSPAGSGDRSGSSAANAKPISALDSAIQRAGAGGTVNLLADKGAYNLSGSVTVSHGGTSSAPVTIQGVSSSGAPMDITVNGTRDATWTPGEAGGNTIFKLYAGANNLVFQNMDFKNIGMAFQLGANLNNVTFQHMTADNVRYFTGTYPGGGSSVASVNGLTLRDIDVNGFSKSVVILKYDSHNILLDDVHGNSEYQDGDHFAMGVALQGTTHDVVIQNSSMANCIGKQATGDYWNGDGFTAEEGTYNIRYVNVVSSGNGDAGFDLKGDNITLDHVRSEDNERNFRFWGDNIQLINSKGIDPHHRGGTGSQAQIWVANGATVKVTGSDLSDSGSATKVVISDGGTISFSNTEIWHASSGTLTTGSGITGLTSSLIHNLSSTGLWSSNGEQYLSDSTGGSQTPTGDTTVPITKTLDGTSNSDTLAPKTADNWTVHGFAGSDKVTTLGGDDKIFGGSGADTISTAGGNDSLNGGSGADILTGGAGSDTFVFKVASESPRSAGDKIIDFVHGTDKMDLSGIDANTKVTGNDAFKFLGTSAFTGHAGELQVAHPDSTKTVILGDTNGDKVADFSVTLTGHIDLMSADFIL